MAPKPLKPSLVAYILHSYFHLNLTVVAAFFCITILQVLHKAVLQCFTVYDIPDIRVDARLCKTNIMSNTAFRGFGSPQSHFIMENIVENVADYLNISPQQVNCYENLK